MSSYSRLQYETDREAEELYSPGSGRGARSDGDIDDDSRSELTGNGIEHSTDNLLRLTELVLQHAWPARR